MGISFLAVLPWEVCGVGTPMAAPSPVFWHCCCLCAMQHHGEQRWGRGGAQRGLVLSSFYAFRCLWGKSKGSFAAKGGELLSALCWGCWDCRAWGGVWCCGGSGGVLTSWIFP